MYTVKFTTAYKKSYKLMKKRGLDISLLDDVVDKLRQGHTPIFSKNENKAACNFNCRLLYSCVGFNTTFEYLLSVDERHINVV